MKILELLFGKNSPEQAPQLKQTEREATIDLLLLAMYADNHLSYSESQNFDHSIESLGWQSPSDLSVYISDATGRARRSLSEPQTTDAFLNHIVERLPSPEGKQLALKLLQQLFVSDGMSVQETAAFQSIEAKLR